MQLLQVRDAIKASIVDKMRQRADALSAGRATDFADYKQGVGRIQGLKDAFECVDGVFNKLLDAED